MAITTVTLSRPNAHDKGLIHGNALAHLIYDGSPALHAAGSWAATPDLDLAALCDAKVHDTFLIIVESDTPCEFVTVKDETPASLDANTIPVAGVAGQALGRQHVLITGSQTGFYIRATA